MATQTHYPLLTAKEFLEIDFGEHKAELDNGVIRMMLGGTARHAEVQTNVVSAMRQRLRGSGCKPYGPDMGVETNEGSVRYPDVSIYCGRTDSNDGEKAFKDPRIIFEVLSAGTARTDLLVKLPEYKALASVDTIVFVDIASERVRIVQRIGPKGWNETGYDEPVDIELPALGVTIPHEEIFARD
ncbi:Uma2 family endonuclease [Sphingomonas sp. dw_22]|uniref:Uma2 family endonuclease n=1 Tax=Sphingomonas sp. dw_22 TaxID=2721175 RepID=UPI001BD2F3EF|nr:Uma2 family endonuclease [Sphingomonas sp. dw_22]